jgi:hypothetical protein
MSGPIPGSSAPINGACMPSNKPREIQLRRIHEADAPYGEGVARRPGLHVEGLMVI